MTIDSTKNDIAKEPIEEEVDEDERSFFNHDTTVVKKNEDEEGEDEGSDHNFIFIDNQI